MRWGLLIVVSLFAVQQALGACPNDRMH